MTEPRIFGVAISPLTAAQVARHILTHPRSVVDGVGLVVTPNIQHVNELVGNAAFRQAYADAEIVTCDGFPVHYYAHLRGCPSPERVTGCDIVAGLMADPSVLRSQRLFFVVDQEETARVLSAWADRYGLVIATRVPPLGFDRDPAGCLQLAHAIADHGATLLFMGVGAPRSEIFVNRHRAILPPCWALCVGQAVKMALGLTRPPPTAFKRFNVEWFWRILQEPRRMVRRYVVSAAGFARAVALDLVSAFPTSERSADSDGEGAA